MTGVSQAAQRRVELEGALNARDLGGLPAADGRVVKSGRVLRMDSPQFLTERAAQQLLDEGLRTIVDLRYETEAAEQGIGFLDHEQIRHVNIPIRSSANQTAPGLREQVEAAAGRPIEEVVSEYYQGYFTTAKGMNITNAVREFANAASLPLLVNCAAGKDRTGCVVATVLAALGVPDEVIADDYAASAEAVPGIIARLADREGYTDIDQSTVDMQITRAGTMMNVLSWLRDEHGGAREFLRSRGMSDAELASLEELLLADSQ